MAATTNDPVIRLRRLASRLLNRGDPDAVWISSAVDAAIAGAPVEEALGLYPGWRTAHRMRQHEALLIELVSRFGPLSSGEIAERIDRFTAGSRKWEPGTISELLYYIARAGALPSARTIRRVLAASRRSGHPLSFDGQAVALFSDHENDEVANIGRGPS
jgi:hypothetical protein